MSRWRSALRVHAVHGDCGLQVVRVQRVVVRMRVPVGVKFVAEQRGCLRRRVQVQVVVVVPDVNTGRERVVVSRWILAVLLWTHGAVAWRRQGEDMWLVGILGTSPSPLLSLLVSCVSYFFYNEWCSVIKSVNDIHSDQRGNAAQHLHIYEAKPLNVCFWTDSFMKQSSELLMANSCSFSQHIVGNDTELGPKELNY